MLRHSRAKAQGSKRSAAGGEKTEVRRKGGRLEVLTRKVAMPGMLGGAQPFLISGVISGGGQFLTGARR
jgi:hypothetical protein